MKQIGLTFLTLHFMLVAFGKASDADTTFLPDKRNKNKVNIEIRGPLGGLLQMGTLVDGQKNGVFRIYNDHEIIAEITEYESDSLHGVKLQFADNGALISEENYYNGQLHGRKNNYRFGGIKKLSEFYEYGKLHGLKTTFYDNGYKQEESNYKNGVRERISRWYNQSEIISIEYTYVMGVLNGLAKTFYFGGKVESMGNFVNDKEEGEWKYFDADGKHIKSIFFKAGKSVKEVLK